MAAACNKCSSPVNGIEKVACRGACGSVFHRTCIPGLQRTALDVIAAFANNLFWLCDDCASRFNEWLYPPAPAVHAVDNSNLCAAVDKLNAVVADLSDRIEKHFPCGPLTSVQRPLFSQMLSVEQPTPKRRREGSFKARTPAAAVCGTRCIQREIKTVPDERQQFWIYLSRLDPSHTVDEIVTMAQECLGMNDKPKAFLLVKKDADVSKLNFVSFRVEVPNGLKDLALTASTWPVGVMVREFNFEQARPDRFRQYYWNYI
ncbi:uncharacterized protein LOC129716940 [Wyeomyia smithii]|uniref:uncharacterized protein LOC129716940 n=1 Tax=Wyeomyia smithii TaxID=174621 RepID=UPI0024681A84|nr:uncharacterized protein LOC129716940 [Wyeomyia smithii]